MNEETQQEPTVLACHGSQLRYTVARIKSAGYEVLDVQPDGDNYIIVVAMPPDAQLPERTTPQRRSQPPGRMLRGVGSGLIVIAVGVALLGPAAATFGTGLAVAAGGVLASSALLLPAALIVLAILAALPFASRSIAKARREYGQR